MEKLGEHDLRSHGGRFEAIVPLLVTQPLSSSYDARLRAANTNNYDLFDIVLNGMEYDNQ